MSDRFQTCVAVILKEEGGYVDDPEDKGGATNFGITRATLARFRGRAIVSDDVRVLTENEARAIYRALYWDAIEGDLLPKGLDLFLFDAAVLSGVSRALHWLQTSLNVPSDGIIGPVTRQALQRADPQSLIVKLYDVRAAAFRATPGFERFGRGWMARLDRLSKVAWAEAATTKPISSPQTLKETVMDNSQPVYASRTIWANLIGVISFVLSITGHGGLDTAGLTDAVLQLVTAGSFVASTLFRVIATKSIAV